ncbi:MAG: TrmH family RNA methyltransferase, partial [Candidatus Omnitrophota bacterium]
MSEAKIITSAQNPRIKAVAKLREKKGRDSQKLFLIDGCRALNFALKNHFPVSELYYCGKFFKPGEEKIIKAAQAKGLSVFNLNEKAFAKIAYGDNPDGIVAVARQQKKELADLPEGKSALYLILDSVEKPGNLGAILRT